MSWFERLDVGMPVHATDGLIGWIASGPRVAHHDPSAPAEILVLGNQETTGPGVEEFLRITNTMIDRVDRGIIYLNISRRRVPAASKPVVPPQRITQAESHTRIPLHDEEVEHGTRVVELGHVRVRKRVDEHVDERNVTLRHNEVQIEHVPVNELIPEMIHPYLDGDTYVIPVVEEEIVLQRRLRLKEEIRIRRVVAEREESMSIPYRRERIEIEEHWADDDDSQPNGRARRR